MGVVLLGEVMMCHGWSGILMLVTGIVLVATDPGDKVVEGGGSGGGDEDAPPLLYVLGCDVFTLWMRFSTVFTNLVVCLLLRQEMDLDCSHLRKRLCFV